MNIWSDPDRKSYIGIIAHWMKYYQKEINLRADLIGFVHILGSHTGKHLAQVFLFIINCLGIAKKVSFLINYVYEFILFID
jgi:hypothetical protein